MSKATDVVYRPLFYLVMFIKPLSKKKRRVMHHIYCEPAPLLPDKDVLALCGAKSTEISANIIYNNGIHYYGDESSFIFDKITVCKNCLYIQNKIVHKIANKHFKTVCGSLKMKGKSDGS